MLSLAVIMGFAGTALGLFNLQLRVRKLEVQVKELLLALYGDEPTAPWDYK